MFINVCYVYWVGFYSHVFLVPKPQQKWRAVIDVSRLFTFLKVEKFKMETPESIRASDYRGMGLNRPFRHIPSHLPNLKEVSAVHSQVSNLPVHPSTLWSSNRG